MNSNSYETADSRNHSRRQPSRHRTAITRAAKGVFLTALAAAVGLGGCRPGQPPQAADNGPAPSANVTETALSKASAVLDREWLTPGAPAELGIRIALQEGWHTYADPPGDSGMAPSISFQLPNGITAGPLQLPPHQTFTDEAGTTFGFEKEVLIRVPITVDAALPIGQAADVALQVQYLLCKDVCVPQSAELTLRVPVRAESAPIAPAWTEAVKQGGWTRGDE